MKRSDKIKEIKARIPELSGSDLDAIYSILCGRSEQLSTGRRILWRMSTKVKYMMQFLKQIYQN